MNKIIFTFWEPKTNIPGYINLCIQTWSKFLPDYKIILLDYSNLKEYIGDFYDESLYINFSLPKQADAIRAAVLYLYGGVWFDADTVITSKKIRFFLENGSKFSLFSRHIGSLSVKKGSIICENWAKECQKRIIDYKNAKENNEDLKQYEVYYYLGNGPLNPYLDKYTNEKKELFVFDRLQNKVIMEGFWKTQSNQIEGNVVDNYLNFYFRDDYSEFILKHECGMLMLHNSWSPQEFKKMEIEEFLNSFTTLSSLFKKILNYSRYNLYITTKNDGNSSRFLNMLQTFYIAEQMGKIENAKFIWNLGDPEKTRQLSACNENVIFSSIQKKEEIFSKKFIEKHFIQTCIKKQILNENNIKEIFKNNNNEEQNIAYAVTMKNLSFLYKDNVEEYKKYRATLKSIWEKIDFNYKYKKIIKAAQLAMPNDFIAIILRSGDVVYRPSIYRLTNPFSFYATTCEILLGVIELFKDTDKKIVIFGDDIESIKIIKQLAVSKNISTIYEYKQLKNMDEMGNYLFDVVALSKAQDIYGTASGLPQLASFINGENEVKNVYQVFDQQTQYNIMCKYFPQLKVSNDQKAFSLLHLYLLSRSLNYPKAIVLGYLDEALKYDNENDKYRIYYLDYLFQKKDIKNIEKILSNILIERKISFFETLLFRTYWTGINYLHFFKNYIKNASENTPAISYVAAKICFLEKDYNNAFKFALYAFNKYSEDQILKNTIDSIVSNLNSCSLENYLIVYLLSLQKQISEKDNLINALTNEKQKLEQDKNQQIQTLNNEKTSLQNSLNSLPTKKAKLEVLNLEQDLINKKLQSKKLAKDIGVKLDVLMPKITFINPNSAKARIHNHLAYKLGSALIRNSKSFLGYIKIPYVLFAITLAHKEQNANSKLIKLPSLESYADYKEALKEKECFTYKLGEALMKAHKNWYKGGYLKFYFKDVPSLKREFEVRKS